VDSRYCSSSSVLCRR